MPLTMHCNDCGNDSSVSDDEFKPQSTIVPLQGLRIIMPKPGTMGWTCRFPGCHSNSVQLTFFLPVKITVG